MIKIIESKSSAVDNEKKIKGKTYFSMYIKGIKEMIRKGCKLLVN